MKFLIVLILQWFSGFILFAKIPLNVGKESHKGNSRVSIIIPARNEEKNLPFILDSLKLQTYIPYEIIVVDDFSSDRTSEIARQYGVKVIQNTQLPDHWTGKTWAVWNGFLQSTGNILVFLDADVRLAPRALEALVHTRERSGGAISVVPYHHTEKFYERLSLVPYLLGIFAFTSPFERKNTQKGLYGSCIVTTREDYVKINGHESIRSELLDDLNLGKKFAQAGINVENFIGCDLVSFRMYPNGIKSELQGFGKGAVLSTATLRPATIVLIALWLLGLFAVGFITPVLLPFRHPLALPFLAAYLIYTMQIIYFLRYMGRYGRIMPVMHFLSSIFFIIIMLYSIYQVTFRGSVTWKGRQVKVGGRKCL
jgi:4,4'-diaponeurosporenoate glycosyltransferase